MKIKGFLLAGAAGAAVSPAMAPDVAMAADMMLKAPPPAAPASWTGWYAGVNAGAARQSSTLAYDFKDCCMGVATSVQTKTGFIGGGQIGFNWQAGSFVYGLEGDISGLTGKVDFGPTSGSYTGRISWLSTVRGRVGVAIGDTMAYVTAGLAIAGVRNKIAGADTIGDHVYSDTRTRLGLALGGGVEHMINRNWTFKLEALWVDAGSKTVPNIGTGSSTEVSRFSNEAIIGRVGFNYRY